VTVIFPHAGPVPRPHLYKFKLTWYLSDYTNTDVQEDAAAVGLRILAAYKMYSV